MVKKRWTALFAAAMALLMFAGPVRYAMAYLTDVGPTMENNFTIALDPQTTIVEKYPDPTPQLDGTVASYEKAVQVANTGYIDCYVRVHLDFTEKDIENKTQFSPDGTTYYSVADYRNHLPSGWVYEDGYYYYTKMLEAQDWDATKAGLTYDDLLGEWFYKEGDQLKSAPCISVPLIRSVKTTFAEPKDMRTYSLNVSQESCPFYMGNDYKQAWANYAAGARKE